MTTILIVEDHGLIAQTVASALRVKGRTVHTIDPVDTDVAAALAAAIAAEPTDLVLLDLDLGVGGDATELIAGVAATDTPVVMVTGVVDPVRLARCVEAGAVGIIDKGRSFDELLDVIDRVLADGTLLSSHDRQDHLATLRAHEHDEQQRLAPFAELSPREEEVLGELMHGYTVDQVAMRSVVSVATVRTQVRAVLHKLYVGSQVAAVSRARECGWIPPQER